MTSSQDWLRLTPKSLPQAKSPDLKSTLSDSWVRRTKKTTRTLDFDIETLAAGFADPNWVPQKVMVAAWSWVGDDVVHTASVGQQGFFSRKVRAEALRPLVEAIKSADILTGHNIIRFDLPVLNADLIRCGEKPLPAVYCQDTMRLPKTKGLKKSQDDLGVMLGTIHKKKTMNWEEWDKGYDDDSWSEIIERCASDVLMHKEILRALPARGISIPTKAWRP